ncbi:hypothetical protein Ae201684_010554 [Aphanomyces euteiches]|uniref:Uncharacterized protein n=1 Tax=Aphanomyces euteiches TaxID=100861 RepID=A0A6G0WXG9_9STRA|nr:hypothetical protein Ae201684_010554 [Aphanomyces euteiches]
MRRTLLQRHTTPFRNDCGMESDWTDKLSFFGDTSWIVFDNNKTLRPSHEHSSCALCGPKDSQLSSWWPSPLARQRGTTLFELLFEYNSNVILPFGSSTERVLSTDVTETQAQE